MRVFAIPETRKPVAPRKGIWSLRPHAKTPALLCAKRSIHPRASGCASRFRARVEPQFSNSCHRTRDLQRRDGGGTQRLDGLQLGRNELGPVFRCVESQHDQFVREWRSSWCQRWCSFPVEYDGDRGGGSQAGARCHSSGIDGVHSHRRSRQLFGRRSGSVQFYRVPRLSRRTLCGQRLTRIGQQHAVSR